MNSAKTFQQQANYLFYAKDSSYDDNGADNDSNDGKSRGRISFELFENNPRSQSVMGKKKRPNSGSFVRDAKDYYRDYDNSSKHMPGETSNKTNRESVNALLSDDLVAECYVGFSKLMQSELRK
jgi:hypothetical protein